MLSGHVRLPVLSTAAAHHATTSSYLRNADRYTHNIITDRDAGRDYNLSLYPAQRLALTQWYNIMYAQNNIHCARMRPKIRVFKRITIFNDKIGADIGRNDRSANVRAFKMSYVNDSNTVTYSVQAAEIQMFIEHSVLLERNNDGGEWTHHTFAFVQWVEGVDLISSRQSPSFKAVDAKLQENDMTPIVVKSTMTAAQSKNLYQSLIRIPHIIDRVLLAKGDLSTAEREMYVVPLLQVARLALCVL